MTCARPQSFLRFCRHDIVQKNSKVFKLHNFKRGCRQDATQLHFANSGYTTLNVAADKTQLNFILQIHGKQSINSSSSNQIINASSVNQIINQSNHQCIINQSNISETKVANEAGVCIKNDDKGYATSVEPFFTPLTLHPLHSTLIIMPRGQAHNALVIYC
ncbi:PREDICTED: uncharacterized protein LOC106807507 [Priapulus caudatus]|uniref:Uncharacterized protein LOC106807507 n=1 Tax=Priapulus caudatus TaxID=37621 RepID=A0ABM1DZG4_PRICU|nr:PREDICTED: uncharacterized protein LOC106807507 [Priapulus caudatus]